MVDQVVQIACNSPAAWRFQAKQPEVRTELSRHGKGEAPGTRGEETSSHVLPAMSSDAPSAHPRICTHPCFCLCAVGGHDASDSSAALPLPRDFVSSGGMNAGDEPWKN